MWLQARRRLAEGISHPLLFAELMASSWMLPGQSCLQVWWHLSDHLSDLRVPAGTLLQGPSCLCWRHELQHSEAQTSALLGTSLWGEGAGRSPAGRRLCPCQA